MTSWSVGQMHYHQATGDLVADPGEGPGGGLALLYFWTKLRPEAPKKNFCRPPPTPLSKGLDDRAPPLSQGLDPALRLFGAKETRTRFM